MKLVHLQCLSARGPVQGAGFLSGVPLTDYVVFPVTGHLLPAMKYVFKGKVCLT
jgi:hypothetical protein